MADSSNADSSQESKGATQGASDGSSSAQDSAPDSANDSAKESAPAAASAPKASAAPVANESGEGPAKPAKAAGTSGWKTPSGKPAAKAPTKTSAQAPGKDPGKDPGKASAKAPAKATSTRTTTAKTSEKPAKDKQPVDANTIRNWLATAIWTLAVIAALIMAAAALAVSLKFNTDNAIVSFVENTADNLKIFGDFKKFTGSNHQVKNVLVNNGIYAVLYLVVGKILDRLIRP